MQDLLTRHSMYSLLSSLFQGVPEHEIAALLRAEPIISELELVLAGESGVAPILARMRSLPLEELAEDLAVDYTMLFSAPGSTHVPPYESVYRDKLEVVMPPQPEIDYAGGTRTFEGLYWGDSTVAVAGEYFIEDFDPGKEIPDSLGLELAFMAHLCDNERFFRESGNVQAAEACAFRQAKFLKEHLMNWVPMFVGRVLEKRPHGFFAVATLLTLRYLEAESGAPAD